MLYDRSLSFTFGEGLKFSGDRA